MRPTGIAAIVAAMVALAAALVLAPAATPAVPPRALLVVAVAALILLAALSRARPLHLLAAILAAIASEHLLFSPGIPRGHDLLAHSWGLYAFFEAMLEGDLHPRWLHHLSLGLPLPVFYSPASYYLLTPFYWLGLSAPQILKAAFVLHAVVGSLGMYLLGRRWTGSSRAGLGAALAYAFGPYRLLVAHYRMALAESAAMALFPILFGLIFDPGPWSRRRVAATALAAGALILVHPLSALTVAVTACLWQGIEWGILGWRRARAGWIGRCAAAIVALALAGAYLAPLAHRLPSISLERAVESGDAGEAWIARHGLRVEQPFRRLPWKEVMSPQPQGHPADRDDRETPVYLGWVLAACVLLGAGLGLRRMIAGAADAVPELPLATVGILAIGLSLHPGAALLSHLPLLPMIQFPFRFLGPATWAGALCVAFVACAFPRTGRGSLLVLALYALVIADGLPFTGAGSWVPSYEGLAHAYVADRDCGRRWGCWQVEPAPEPFPRRVSGAFLPPTTFGTDVAHVKPGFGEYLNRQALETVLEANASGAWGRLGAAWFGPFDRPGIERLVAEPYVAWLEGGSTAEESLRWDRWRGRLRVDLAGRGGDLRILEQYNPGWKVLVDGDEASPYATADGMIAVRVPSGARRAELFFEVAGPDVWLGRALSILAVAACGLLILRGGLPSKV